MSKLPLLAAAIISVSGTVATANPAAIGPDCEGGDLTLARLADAGCMSRIPLPTARPDSVKTAAATPVREWEFIETPGVAPGETRMVRIVGSRFLPDRSEKIDFRARASDNAGFINAAFQSTVSYLGLDSEPKFAEAPTVQEARVDFDALALRN